MQIAAIIMPEEKFFARTMTKLSPEKQKTARHNLLRATINAAPQLIPRHN
jgi:hypothetical protein